MASGRNRASGGEHPFGPFINRNHFAGWMVMALPLVVGYSCCRSRRRGRRVRRRGAIGCDGWSRVDASRFLLWSHRRALLMAARSCSRGSRSGIASLAVAMAVLFSVRAPRLRARGARGWSRVTAPFWLAGRLGWNRRSTVERFLAGVAPIRPVGLIGLARHARIISDFPLVRHRTRHVRPGHARVPDARAAT